MCIKDYIGITLTIVFVISFVGCIKFFGSWNHFGVFWFYAGLLITSGTILCRRVAEV